MSIARSRREPTGTANSTWAARFLFGLIAVLLFSGAPGSASAQTGAQETPHSITIGAITESQQSTLPVQTRLDRDAPCCDECDSADLAPSPAVLRTNEGKEPTFMPASHISPLAVVNQTHIQKDKGPARWTYDSAPRSGQTVLLRSSRLLI